MYLTQLESRSNNHFALAGKNKPSNKLTPHVCFDVKILPLVTVGRCDGPVGKKTLAPPSTDLDEKQGTCVLSRSHFHSQACFEGAEAVHLLGWNFLKRVMHPAEKQNKTKFLHRSGLPIAGTSEQKQQHSPLPHVHRLLCTNEAVDNSAGVSPMLPSSRDCHCEVQRLWENLLEPVFPEDARAKSLCRLRCCDGRMAFLEEG